MEGYTFKAVSDLVFTDDFMFGAVMREVLSMVQAKKFENTFINEYLAIQLHKHDIENRAKAEGLAEGKRAGISIGMAEGGMAMSVDLIKSGLLSEKDAAEKLGISEEELRAKL